MVDDLRPELAGLYGQNEIATPNLQRLMADGFTFEYAYCRFSLDYVLILLVYGRLVNIFVTKCLITLAKMGSHYRNILKTLATIGLLEAVRYGIQVHHLVDAHIALKRPHANWYGPSKWFEHYDLNNISIASNPFPPKNMPSVAFVTNNSEIS